MKKLIFTAAFLALFGIARSQNTAWTTTATSIGLGTTTPAYQFHLHGATTSQIGFTTTGNATNGRIKLQGSILSIDNLTNGNITMGTNTLLFSMIGQNSRAFFGNTSASTATTYAKLNVMSNDDNALYLRTTAAGFYGLSIKSYSDADIAIQARGTDANLNTFTLKGNGSIKLVTSGMAATDEVLTIYNSPSQTQKILQLENSGLLLAREIKVNAVAWPDYVFAPTYHLMSLQEVEAYIKAENHLPNVPSQSTVVAEGINVADMNRILMEKIEELTLYMIAQDKKVLEQEAKIAELEAIVKCR
jgi:hypothetical protein